MTPVFTYETGPDGRPAARPILGAYAGLAAFLTEEASWSDYAGILLDLAAESVAADGPRVHTGNAYAVTIEGDAVAIEHLHRARQVPGTAPLAVFVQALREWRAFLDRTQD